MAQVPDSFLIVGPQFAEQSAASIYLTPTGGAQQTLADALANGGTTPLIANGITSNATGLIGSVPANGYILRALLRNTTANAVNVTFGTTTGAADVAPTPAAGTLTVPANGTLVVDVGSLLKPWFSTSTSQAVWLASASWGGASVNAQLFYIKGP